MIVKEDPESIKVVVEALVIEVTKRKNQKNLIEVKKEVIKYCETLLLLFISIIFFNIYNVII